LSIHKGKRSYHCSFCPAKFNLNENLNRHYDKVHEKKNPNECSICFTTLGSKANLKRHYDTVHEKKKPYECSICFTKFGEKGNLNHHSRSALCMKKNSRRIFILEILNLIGSNSVKIMRRINHENALFVRLS
jgi:uncharacterized Zn-finger protein